MTPIEGVPSALALAMRAHGFTGLTEIQAAIRDRPDPRRDLLVSAPTGSGKTVAIGLALAPDLSEPGPAPRALVLVPTRELAAQVRGELAWLHHAAGIRVALCAGGADPGAEARALGRGADLVVATPGRLLAHLRSGAFDPRGLATLVLDEADELLARGFREDLGRILARAPAGRRLCLFSATLSPAVVALAARHQRDARRVEIAGGARPGVVHEAIAVAAAERDRVTGNLLCLTDPARALVFAGRRDGVAPLVRHLEGRGFRAVALSGALDQGARDAALAALRGGGARVCVATDLAARGLDLPGLDLVIHADPPVSPEALAHRSGRTGRAGRAGHVVLLAPPSGRRRLVALARRAGIALHWRAEPAAEEVAARERARLLGSVGAEAPEAAGSDAALLEALRGRGAHHLARAFAAGWHAARPRFAPPATPSAAPSAAPSAPPSAVPPAAPAGGPVWFSLNRGGGQGDLRRLLPLIRRIGGARREDIGRVRVFAAETHFEALAPAVPGFLTALGRESDGPALRLLSGH
ncbi:DEAD/DEAH box helicase [Amaricoccus solimangrovi]|uniref:DEAD/DEAH box helicase n=1 Tax=Amaricoccus solimangrovi TaxID=2589815 RepID=A0A501WWC9_9RHOB|nr:DEAD/DEAH box helicase [Amaricoccus solimangrovi]TPE53768.1 DEAD/DEAH box helicase [Amaricoccus solimangrovi]